MVVERKHSVFFTPTESLLIISWHQSMREDSGLPDGDCGIFAVLYCLGAWWTNPRRLKGELILRRDVEALEVKANR